MFAMLSGEIVHIGETAQHVVMLAGTEPARSLATVAPGVDARIVAIVDQALALEKADRWPSAFAMRSAIRDASLVIFGRTPVLPSFKPSDPAIKSTLPSGPDINASVASRPSQPASVDRSVPPAGTAAPGVAPARVHVVGSTTSKPVSSEAPTVPRPTFTKLPVSLLVAGAVTVVSFITVGAVVAFRGTDRPMATAPGKSIASSRAALPPPLLTQQENPPAVIDSRAIPTITVSELAPASPPTPPRVALATARPTTPKTSPSTATPTPLTPKNCNPPFVVDPATGKKNFKLECL
jgi:serine/threonine-protein kinase